ncbi:disulfide oxidoreductase [Candidatus Nanohalobium constans]|uniref:Disulfide bond formation protein DsbB n=1 Tax=Candidatus Nanohalobium constans TaxID=2565781 RepID=A0A5Q0UHY5_9ARCH|nr:disulfide oxidoreductase [Candidatus Nanohalobium constans]QGA80499.1 disulfide bond formation protein DsbB [Candidatus Nanohalobium constans]
MDPIIEILSIGTLLLEAAIILGFGVFTAARFGYAEELWQKIENYLNGYWKELSFALALIATSGSLYASNILGYTPCHLCWLQRIMMYPLVILFGVSWLLDTDVVEYAVPMATIGGGIAGYHYAIQRIEQFSSAGCSITQVSCETEYTFYMGIVTIPLMAFTAFLGILLVNWKYGDEI